ncbi:MAG: hypothetical protein C0449_14410 [Polaromonas sp.]|nr:hypothetical protein [Polaromonas sp.]
MVKSLRLAVVATLVLGGFAAYVSLSLGPDGDLWGDLWAFVVLPAVAGYLIGYLLGVRARNQR